MPSYKFTNQAVEDLNSIWMYSFENWSELQADKYYDQLLNSCQKIAITPQIGKKYEDIRKELFGFKVNKHIIFYRKLENEIIEITRILHEKMDFKSRLNQ